MATAKEVLALVITGDGRGAITELEKVGSAAEREIGRSQKSIDQISGRLTTFGVAAVGAGTVAAVGLYGAAQAAGVLETNIARIEGNFGSASAGALQFVQDANSIGLSDGQAAQYVANIGELAVGLGIGQEAAAAMTTETVSLVAQLGYLKGQSPAQSLEAVNAALIGEYDSLQRLVPSINAAAIEERALADTRKSSAKDLTQAEKAVATFAIVNESAAKTIERSGGIADNAALRNAQLAASYDEMRTALGDGALPVLEDLASAGTAVFSTFNAVDDVSGGLVSSMATVVTVGSLVAGGLSLVAGQGIKVHQMFTDLNGPLRTADGGFSRVGKAAAGVTPALVGIGVGIAVVDQLNRSAVGAAGSVEELQAALADSSGDRMSDTLDQILREIDGKADSIGDVINGLLTNAKLDLGGFSGGAFFEDDRSLKAVKDDLEQLAAIDPEGAEQLLDAIDRAVAADPNFFPNEGARDEWLELSAALRRTVDTQRLATSSTTGLAGATSGLTNEVESSTTALQERLEPILKLLDAQERLEDAEKKLADAADTNGRDVQQASRGVADARQRVVDATRDLTDAQAELNDVLADDPMFGLRSVSPEEEIADARTRLAEANRLLAENPGNAMALTMRDTAVLDLEDASRRQQDERRNGEQRADEIANAQRAVEDAQRGLADANQGVVDAQGQLAEVQSQHGLNSEAYADAAQEVIEASIGVWLADEELAEYLKENGITAVTELNAQLDEWIAKGGPVGEAAATMKAQIEPLVQQALTLAGAVGAAAGAYDVLIGRMALFAITAGQAAGAAAAAGAGRIAGAIGVGGPPQNVPVDQFGIPLYGRPGAATGGLVMGDGTGTSDDVDARLSNGEFVLRASTTAAIGPAMLAQVNQTGRLPQIVREQPSSSSTVRSEGDLIIDGVQIVQHVSDDGLAGAAAVGALRDVARRSGRGLRASSKLVA